MRTAQYLAYFMCVFFLFIGILCLIAPANNLWLPGNRRYVMAAVLVSYATIRYYRTRKLSREIE